MKERTVMDRLDRIEMELKEIKRLLLTRDGKTEEIKPADPEGFISVKEVAQLLQCTIQAVYTRCAQNELPHLKMGKSYKFKKSDILRWMQQQKPASAFSVDDYVDRYLKKNILKG